MPLSLAEDRVTFAVFPVVTAGGVVVVNVWSAPTVVPALLTATSR